MMRMQHDSLSNTFLIVSTTLLASVMVALKNRFAPLYIFNLVACYIILMAFIYVSSPFRLVCLFCLLAGSWVGKFSAAGGTDFALAALFLVLGHRHVTDRAGNCYQKAFWTNKLNIVYLFKSAVAYSTCNADAPSICRFACCTGKASGSLGRSAVNRNCWRRLSTTGARHGAFCHTIVTDRVKRFLVAFSTVLMSAHVTILPQLAE